MIQIDDAGWGSLIGPTVIGVYDTERGRFAFRALPMHVFQGEAFRNKAYLEAAKDAVREALAELGVELRGLRVEVCTGYVLSRVRSWLAAQGCSVHPVRIGEPLQTLVETAFLQLLQRIDYPARPEVMSDPKRSFYDALRWLKGGNPAALRVIPERERWAKTGWKSYRLWVERSCRAPARAGTRMRGR